MLPSDVALTIDLADNSLVVTVPHNQGTLRSDGAFPSPCRLDDAVRNRQQIRRAVWPASRFGGRGARILDRLCRYANILAIERCCRRSRGLRGNWRRQREGTS